MSSHWRFDCIRTPPPPKKNKKIKNTKKKDLHLNPLTMSTPKTNNNLRLPANSIGISGWTEEDYSTNLDTHDEKTW